MGFFKDFKGDTIGDITPEDNYETFRTSVNNKVIRKIYATAAGTVAYRDEADATATVHTITMADTSVFYGNMVQILDTGTDATGIVGFE